MSKLRFPSNFWWGGAMSTEQVDGEGFNQKGLTIWDALHKQKPELFHNQIGPQNAIEFIKNYQSDLKLFQQIGLNSIRHGFSWARLFPDGKNIDQEAVKYYHNFIDYAKKLNITLVMQLHHFDMPWWAQQKGGWESLEVIEEFVKFCDFIFQEYGSKVKYFSTMNEPLVTIGGGYLYKWHYPLVNDPKRAMQAGFGFILAHAKVVNLFNQKYKKKLKSQIGLVGSIIYALPKDNINFTIEDQKATNDWNLIFFYGLHDPMILGKFPVGLKEILQKHQILPNYTKEQLAEIAQVKLDFLGINYYGPARKQYDPQASDFESKIAAPFAWDKARMNVFRGWEIHPQSFYNAMMLVKKHYHNIPFFISENGMGVQQEWKYRDFKTGEIADDYRIAFIKEHLQMVHQAISNGANCFGYHLWSAIDCWSFLNGFRNTYGLIEVDLKDHLKRRFKKSAHFYHHLIKDNGFDNQYQKVEEIFDLANVSYEQSI